MVRQGWPVSAWVVLILGLGLSVAVPAQAQPGLGPSRYPLDDPADVKAGSFFMEYSGLLVPNPSLETGDARVMGGSERQAEFAAAVSAMETNVLGRELMRGLDAVRSAVLAIRVLRALFREDDVFNAQVDAAEHLVRMPDGSQRRLPVEFARQLQRGMARFAARELARRPGAPPIAGRYTARIEGSDCPLETGPVELVQQGRAAEVVRDGRLLFGVIVGESEMASLANEQRYATIVRAVDGARIEAPDRPSELYIGALGATDIVLAGSKFNLCTVTLARPG